MSFLPKHFPPFPEISAFELHATLQGSTDRWVLTSPGGLASTFGDLPGLREFASIVLGRDRVPVSYQAA